MKIYIVEQKTEKKIMQLPLGFPLPNKDNLLKIGRETEKKIYQVINIDHIYSKRIINVRVVKI